MYFKNRDKRNKNDILIGGFDDYSKAQHAQQILKDFGYSENAVKVVELFHIDRRMRDAREIGQRIINRVMMICAILISIIFTTLACLFLRSIFSPLEIGMVFLVWITLMSGGVMICCFIGAVVWKLINSEAVDWGLEAVRRKRILISVKLRNHDDAKEIEQMWREMGGEVV
jgi:magnesium-transporting ATPase (P-type)